MCVCHENFAGNEKNGANEKSYDFAIIHEIIYLLKALLYVHHILLINYY